MPRSSSACATTKKSSPTSRWRGSATTSSPTPSPSWSASPSTVRRAATVLQDLREIGPTYFFAPPRIWESLLTTVMLRVEDAAWPKRRLVRFFLDLAQDLERGRLGG